MCDIGAYTDAELKAEIEQAVILQMGLLALKYIYAEDVIEQLREMVGLMQALAQQATGRDYLLTLLRYMSATAPHLDKQEFRRVVQQMIEKGDKLMATVAEQWIEEGLEKGLKQGRVEGREEGREVTLKVLRHYLSARFNLALDHFDAVLRTFDLPTLNHLSDAAFKAESLADFEAALQTLMTARSGDESATNA